MSKHIDSQTLIEAKRYLYESVYPYYNASLVMYFKEEFAQYGNIDITYDKVNNKICATFPDDCIDKLPSANKLYGNACNALDKFFDSVEIILELKNVEIGGMNLVDLVVLNIHSFYNCFILSNKYIEIAL